MKHPGLLLLLLGWALACSLASPPLPIPPESFSSDRVGGSPENIEVTIRRLEQVVPADVQVRIRGTAQAERNEDWDTVERTVSKWLQEPESPLRAWFRTTYGLEDPRETTVLTVRSFWRQLHDLPVDVADTLRDERARADTIRNGSINALGLHLVVVRRAATDLRQAVLKLTATNTSTKPLIVDRDGVYGFYLDVRFEPDEPDFTPAPQHQTSTRPSPAERASRLRPLQSGESLTREFDLTRPVRVVHSGWAMLVSGMDVPFVYQADDPIRCPPIARTLTAEVRYEGRIGPLGWFSEGPEDLGIWHGSAASNAIVIERGSPISGCAQLSTFDFGHRSRTGPNACRASCGRIVRTVRTGPTQIAISLPTTRE